MLAGTLSYAQGYTWEELTTSPTDENINAVSFINPNEGWIACDGGDIWHTSDGGQTWDLRKLLSVTVDANDIQFMDENMGWACGEFGILIRTTDGGLNWLPTYVGTEYVVEDIHMITAAYGLAAGHSISTYNEQMWMTTDSGATWVETIDSPGNLAIYGLHSPASDPDVVVGCGKDNLIGYSSDGGATWTESTIDATGTSLPDPMAWEAIHMVNGSIGFAVGWDHHKALTFDGGVNWVVQAGSGTGMLRDVEGYGSSIVMTCGTDGFAWTEDGGTGWNYPGFSIPVAQLEGISIVYEQTAYIVGDEGIIYKSPAASIDLIPEAYDGPKEICGDGLFPVSVLVKNDGDVEATSATFTVFDSGGAELLAIDWTGSIAPGTTQYVYLGKISITEDESIQIIISGDDYTDNNSFTQVLDYMVPVGIGVDTPVEVCGGESVELNAFGGLSYEWFEEDEVSDASTHNPTVNPTQNSTYTVGIAGLVCYGSFQVDVEVISACNDQPTAFSPNGDGTNDYFHIAGVAANENNEFRVFNRWGAEIRYIQNYDNSNASWLGKDDGMKELPAGTYYYTFKNMDTDREVSGWVSLLR